ncbi:hypothetical protein TCAL_15887 [Tigriopus californicus]|uniref:Uncharacterized protein n=1 Tax=Tigriopus californicus TaxID=6832 RepID=A0A553NP96_TIGCA|nr:hypothetical protein TCAL_15887 [Tigriopus californicus]
MGKSNMSRRDQDRSRKRQPGTLGYVPTQPRSKSRPGHGRTSQYSKYFSKRREHERQERERVVGHRKEEDRVSSGDRDSDARSADKNRRASLGSDGRNSPKASYDRRDSRYGRSMSRDRREKSFDVEDPIDAPDEDLGRARTGMTLREVDTILVIEMVLQEADMIPETGMIGMVLREVDTIPVTGTTLESTE